MLSRLTAKLKGYASEHELSLEDTSFLLSFSGGVDSTIMALLLLHLKDLTGFQPQKTQIH